MFFRKRRRSEELGNEEVAGQEVQAHVPPIHFQPSFKRDGSVALQFALPWDVPKNLRDATTGFDAASSNLTENEIKVLELRASIVQDLEFYLGYRPVDIDRMGKRLIEEHMQRELYAKIRLAKSKNAKILDLSAKTISEFRHHSESNGNGKSWWRRF